MDLILNQLPVISRSADMLRSNQYFLHQRWLSAGLHTEHLRDGKGLLPFAPSSRAHYALARKSRALDYELVTRVFDKMVAVSGGVVQHDSRRLIAKCHCRSPEETEW